VIKAILFLYGELMNAHYLQHVPFEGLGHIENWLLKNNYKITATKFFENTNLPDVDSIDRLFIMGGPMSINDEDIYPWLRLEKDFVRRYIATGKPVVGFCLGAQMLANVLGARVLPNPCKEIGWYEIRPCTSALKPFLGESEMVFHWHGETFELPEHAIRLAESEACLNQAFQFKNSVFGFQFHWEETPETVDNIIAHCQNELTTGPFIQEVEKIRLLTQKYYQQANAALEAFLAHL
jgi:GMP synthase-like glutamine amidotransferase